MPELTDTQATALRSIVETLGPALSNTISENIGRLALVDEPVLGECALADMMRDADTLLQTDWTFPTLTQDTVTLTLSGVDALELAAVVTGADRPEPELTDDVLTFLSPVMQGIAQGVAIALGTVTNSHLQAFNPTCSAAPISVGAAFVTAGAAVSIQVAYHVQGGPDGALTIYLTPGTAAALANLAGPSAGAADVGVPDMTGMMSGFFGGQAPGGATGADDISAGLGAFGASLDGPIAGGPLAGGPLPAGNPFQAFEPISSVPDGVSRSMDLIMDIPLDVSVELGRVQMLIKDVLELATGSIVELERVAGEPVDLLVNGQLIAKGEVVVIEDNFGIRITEIVSPADRLSGMGKRAA